MAKTRIDWRPIPNFSGYFVSNDGRILSLKNKMPRILKHILSKDGHHYVFLYKNNKMHKMWVHRAVLLAFDREPLPNEECRHLDGNPSNNKLRKSLLGNKTRKHR